uniref:BTB domain-containing protein n=1 Tax=Panagrellus redivivus TaxID=6233 RepID=A0A7E4VJ50_PANRE
MSADPNPEIADILDKIGKLFLNNIYSDVEFVVEGERLPAHQIILSQRSPVFEAMFPPSNELQKQVVELPETPLKTFKLLLKFIYTGTVEFGTVNVASVFDVVSIANTYEMPRLIERCIDHLKSICAVGNVVDVLNKAIEKLQQTLVDHCIDYVCAHCAELIGHESFKKLPVKALHSVLEKPIPEVSDNSVFRAFVEWMKANPSESAHFPELLKLMDLKTIGIDEIIGTIRPLSLVDANVLLDLACEHAKKAKMLDGHALTSDSLTTVPIVTGERPAFFKTAKTTISGEKLVNLMSELAIEQEKNAPVAVIPRETSSSFVNPTKDVIMKHVIGIGNECITIDMERPFLANTLEMKLADGDCSYCIHVSQDNVNWTRIIDYSKYICRSVQRLYFKEHVIRYLRIHGTAPIDGTFEISNFVTYYDAKPLEVDPETGCVIPTHNVALAKNNAVVIQGQHWLSPDAMINGNTSDGCAYHYIGEDPIIVQLPQPYLLDSMILLLNADIAYSYNIEVSTDKKTWKRLFSEEYVSSWRCAKFKKQPVVFIKITGTYTMAFNFVCKHLETPIIDIF